MKTIALLLLLALTLSAQQPRKLTIDSETDEGKLLQQIEQQGDQPKKQALLEQFISKYPKHQGAPWVYRQLQAIYIKQNQFDKALDSGTQALALDSKDLDASFNNLKAAEGKKDTDEIKKWALKTSQLALRNASAPADYAKQVGLYCEYSLYALAVRNTDPAKVNELIETLEQVNPRSQYLVKAHANYLASLRQTGDVDKAGIAAEKLADQNQANEDVLLIAADYNLQKKNQPDKVLLYSKKLIEYLQAQPQPEEGKRADWEKKKRALLAHANWMAGVTYSGMAKYVEADQHLGAALPDLKDEQIRAVALFHLGLADYQLGKARKDRTLIEDALLYSEKSAAIAGPLQLLAQKNVRAIRNELGWR